MSNANESSILPLLEEATQAAPDSIAPQQALPDLDGWDSMGMVMFIGLVKMRRGVELSVHQLRECAVVLDLQRLVDAP